LYIIVFLNSPIDFKYFLCIITYIYLQQFSSVITPNLNEIEQNGLHVLILTFCDLSFDNIFNFDRCQKFYVSKKIDTCEIFPYDHAIDLKKLR